jgi:DNA polymerase III beta subunit
LNVVVNRKALIVALKQVKAAVAKKTSIAIVRHVKLVVVDGLLLLTGTDLTTVLTCVCKAKGVNGEGCIPPDKALVFLEQATAESVSLIATYKNMLKIEAGNSSYLVDFLPAKDFPDLEHKIDRHKAKPITIPSFLTALGKVSYAIAKDDCRPALTGVSIKFLKNCSEIQLCAADGFRMALTMAKYKTEYKFKKEAPRQYIIPREAVALIQSLKTEKVNMYIGEGFLEFDCGHAVIGTFPINGTYPDYDKLIPDRKAMKFITFDRSEMLNAVKAIIAAKEYKMHPLRVEPKRGGVIKIWTQDGDGHNLSFNITGKGREKIAFNSSLLRDFVTVVSGDMVKMRLTTGSSPALIDHHHDTHLLMPMNVVW